MSARAHGPPVDRRGNEYFSPGVDVAMATFTGPGGDFVDLNWFQFAH